MPDSVFAHAFEGGHLIDRSSRITGSGGLTVTIPAAMSGTYGREVLMTRTSARYLRDTFPSAETCYRVYFFFSHPNF